MKLTDMFCKHAIRRNSDDLKTKEDKLYAESCKLGYKVCNWGLPIVHVSDIQYNINSIVQMESAKYSNRLENAIYHSSTVFSAWDEDRLVGLLSALDDTMHAYGIYLLVNPAYQNRKVG